MNLISLTLTFLLLSFNFAHADATFDQAKAMFKPISKVKNFDKNLVSLGKKLYLDKRLSADNTISCNTCHLLNKFGVDGLATSKGIKGQFGGRNAPTSFNAFMHLAQFWDGRAEDVEAQALGPILNPIEMGMASESAVVEKLAKISDYQTLFKKAFGGDNALTYKNIGVAIGAFERTLVTPGRFDQYLSGKKGALNAAEKRGLQKFMAVGCTACHAGSAIGGQMYQKLGLVKPYETKDLGRYEHTKNEADKYFFKVPSLRNIAKTGPYFHDGSIKTLESAVDIMAEYQLGKKLSKNDKSDIVAFLKSLTGKL